jgi:DNA-binding transcriptional MerR regulator
MNFDLNNLTTINDFADRNNINVSTLRYYQRLGLLIPLKKIGKHLFFDKKDLDYRFKFIESYKKEGYPIKLIIKKINEKK